MPDMELRAQAMLDYPDGNEDDHHTMSSSDHPAATSGSSRTSRCRWLSRFANPPTATAKISASSCNRRSIQGCIVCSFLLFLLSSRDQPTTKGTDRDRGYTRNSHRMSGRM